MEPIFVYLSYSFLGFALNECCPYSGGLCPLCSFGYFHSLFFGCFLFSNCFERDRKSAFMRSLRFQTAGYRGGVNCLITSDTSSSSTAQPDPTSNSKHTATTARSSIYFATSNLLAYWNNWDSRLR